MVGAQGEFPGITGGPDKGYIAITPRDTTGAGAEASLSIGPVTEHFSNQARNSNASLVYGLAPTFAFVPAGYELETVLVASAANPQKAAAASAPADPARASIPSGGVNAALMEFGDFLLKRHGKTRAAGDIRPETTYIGEPPLSPACVSCSSQDACDVVVDRLFYHRNDLHEQFLRAALLR